MPVHQVNELMVRMMMYEICILYFFHRHNSLWRLMLTLNPYVWIKNKRRKFIYINFHILKKFITSTYLVPLFNCALIVSCVGFQEFHILFGQFIFASTTTHLSFLLFLTISRNFYCKHKKLRK